MTHRTLGFVCAALLVAGPACASDLADWSVSPASLDWGDWSASLGGEAGATASAADAGARRDAASFAVLLLPRLERDLDNGWQIGARGAVLAYHDRLAGDVYGDRTFEKASLFAQTPYGRFEAGQQDGVAYRMAVIGPSVDEQTAIDGAGTTFFRNPATGRAFIDIFRLETAELATANDAKFSYVSPRLFGVQLGGSYTPYDAHGGLPFVSRGATGADRQTNMLEGAADYAGNFGATSLALYAGAVLGHDAARTAAHGNLVDWSIGGEADRMLGEIKLAIGGGFRRTNAYAFDIGDARTDGQTNAWRLSATATKGPWIAGVEYAGGVADRADTRPGLDIHGYEASLGYVVNSNLQLTLGWQELHYRRDTGTFFSGSPAATLNAAFLRLGFHA